MLKLKKIKNEIVKYGIQIGLNKKSSLYPMFCEPDRVFNEGESIYVTATQYHYIIMERGQVIKHYASDKIEDVIYPLFRNITFALAAKYELENRNSAEDPRKLLWKKQLELLKIVDIDFYNIRRKEIEEILKNFPYSGCIN